MKSQLIGRKLSSPPFIVQDCSQHQHAISMPTNTGGDPETGVSPFLDPFVSFIQSSSPSRRFVKSRTDDSRFSPKDCQHSGFWCTLSSDTPSGLRRGSELKRHCDALRHVPSRSFKGDDLLHHLRHLPSKSFKRGDVQNQPQSLHPTTHNLLWKIFSSFCERPNSVQRPDKHTDRAAWNANFEREICLRYTSFARNLSKTQQFPELARNVRESDMMELNQSLALLIKDIIEQESALVARTFETDWSVLDAERKEALVLEGLYRGACAALPEQIRAICPEDGQRAHRQRRIQSHPHGLKRVHEHNPTDSATRNENLFLFAQPDITAEFPSTGGTDANYTSAKFYESRL
ncbi:hypothetical protein B0H14DRAFT_2565527 [Mycena olivaceomarginata]|nr:hypothetical protein B0H14DRAFT_2565527 [Mycena olivaceomarginata]